MSQRRPRRRLTPRVRVEKKEKNMTPREMLAAETRELLDQLAYISISDPDAEQEFARLLEKEFERLGVPPPQLDIYDDIDYIVNRAVQHLREYEDIVMPVKPPSDIEEKESLEMLALGIIAAAAKITISWYSPKQSVTVEWPRAKTGETNDTAMQ